MRSSVSRSRTRRGAFIFKDANRNPADGSLSDQLSADESEMIGPALPARIEQRRQLTSVRIDPAEVGPFMEIAAVARQGEIVEGIDSAVFARNDVLNLENQRRMRCPQMTILAAIAGAAAHPAAQRGIH
jgi:hypothetical protein